MGECEKWLPAEKMKISQITPDDADKIIQEINEAKIKDGDAFIHHFEDRISIDQIAPINRLLQAAKDYSAVSGAFDNDEELLNAIYEYVEMCRAIKKEPVRMKIVSWIAHYFVSQHSFLTFEDTQEIYIYSEEAGIYLGGGEQIIRAQYQKLIDAAANEQRDLSKYANMSSINETIDMARRLTMKKRDEIEPPENLICLSNGILDLDDGLIKPFGPQYYFLSKLAVSYDEKAACPEVIKFLDSIMPKQDHTLIYEIIGSMLVRSNAFQKGVCAVGEGSNGKSTLVSLIRTFLGKDNIASVSIQELEEDRFAAANLYQKHANLVADMSSDDLKSTAKFKSALGGDLIRAQNKNGQPFFFINYAKFFISCNRLPKSPDDSRAFYRRLIILPFDECFEGKEDRGILARMTTPTELSGLLNLAITAYKGVRAVGRYTYDSDADSIRLRYIRLSDSATAFCADMLESCDDGMDEDNSLAGIRKEELWNGYLLFCRKNKSIMESEKKFWEVVKSRFIVVEYRPSKTYDDQRRRRIKGVKWKGS